MQPSHDTFTVPASAEVIAYEQQRALEVAMPRHEADPNDIEQRRVETSATTTVAAVETPQPNPTEAYFDPKDIEQLSRVALLVLTLRKAELARNTEQ